MTGAGELVQIVTTDLVALTRGRSMADGAWRGGVGWVPANLALDPFDVIATPNTWGSSGDLRLRPDPATELRVDGIAGRPPLHLCFADIVDLDGSAWDCCPRGFLRRAVADLEAAGLRLAASFEHEFTLLDSATRAAPAFSLAAHRRAEPFLTALFAALAAAGAAPEVILAEYGPHQIEVTCAPTDALAAADRAVIVREVTREIADTCGRQASFCPMTSAESIGNGVHIHFSLRDLAGVPVTYDPTRPGDLSAAAAAFAAGVVRHLPALCAITAPAPVSYLRLVPHRWSAAFACLGQRNREAAVRICPLPAGAADPARAFNLEYRPSDATSNPYLALGAILRAGLAGLREPMQLPPLVNTDPADLTPAERQALGIVRLPDSLGAALTAFAADSVVSDWFAPDLLRTFHAVKRQEIARAADLSPDALCHRYRAVY